MDSLSINKVFSVPEDYTLEQLKKSYIDIMEKLLNSDRTQVEKNLLEEQYKKLYHRAKRLYLERVSMESDVEYPHNYCSPNQYSNELDLYDRFDRIFDNSFGLRRNIFSGNNPFTLYDNIFNQLNSQSKSHSNPNPNPNPNPKPYPISNINSNGTSQVYSYSSSYSSKTNPDGSRTIVEHKTESTNGDKKKTINAYKKMPDGRVVNLNEDEMKQLEKMSNLQIEN
jgi:hypothetical protein